jgi:hypothetical protein
MKITAGKIPIEFRFILIKLKFTLIEHRFILITLQYMLLNHNFIASSQPGKESKINRYAEQMRRESA